MGIFAPTKPARMVAHQLQEAERALLECEAAAEAYEAEAASSRIKANMYRTRVERLRSKNAPTPANATV